jgi:hypothetical protein
MKGEKERSTMKRLQMMLLIGLFLVPPLCADASELGGMRFSFIRGDVQVRTEDTQDWVPASINMPLREGDRIWVPEEGMAELQTKDGSYLRLAERSALEILTLDRDSYQTYLTEGRLYGNFRGGRDSFLQVDTPASSVRAYERAKFNVDVHERGPVNVSVFQGDVNVESREGGIKVASGEVLSLGEGAYSEKSTLGSPDNWERWNYERDTKVAERRPPSRHLPDELQPYSRDFHDNGRWVHTPDYGYVWTPTVSVSVGWAPYRHGRWVWMRGDYVWVSYEPWGWVPYHYGRWFFAASIGWCWVPPVRGAVYWGPGYVGWVYTSNRVAWVPLAPREVYYGRGHYGPHSVNIANVNVTHVHVDKVVYKNVNVTHAVTTVNHETFVRGKPAEAHVKENPFLTEKVHVGRPPIKPEKASAMPVVREVPKTKRPPEPIQQVNVRELKEQRPMVKQKEASVFTPDAQPRQMPVKAGEAKPPEKKTERTKELRQPAKRAEEPRPSASAGKRGSQPVAAETKVQTQKEPGKAEKPSDKTRSPEPAVTKAPEQKQRAPEVKESSQPATSEPGGKPSKEKRSSGRGMERSTPSSSSSAEPQERGQEKQQNKRNIQMAPSEPAVRAPKEVSSPERGSDRRMESRSPEKAMQQSKPPERVQPEGKEPVSPEKVLPQAPEPKTPDKRTERQGRGPRTADKGA